MERLGQRREKPSLFYILPDKRIIGLRIAPDGETLTFHEQLITRLETIIYRQVPSSDLGAEGLLFVDQFTKKMEGTPAVKNGNGACSHEYDPG